MTENNSQTLENSTSERLTEIMAQLTHNQVRFVVAMLESTNKKEAAEAIGIQPDTTYRWPSVVDEAVELMRLNVAQGAKEMITKNVAKAALVKVAGLDDEDPRVRQAAATEVLDRALGKPTQKTEVTGADGEPLKVKQYVSFSPDDWDEDSL